MKVATVVVNDHEGRDGVPLLEFTLRLKFSFSGSSFVEQKTTF